MGGCKTYGGGKRTRERALPKILGPLQKSFCFALSWILVQERQSTDTWEGWRTYRTRGGSQTPFWEGCHSWGFAPPSFFQPPTVSSDEDLSKPLRTPRAVTPLTVAGFPWLTDLSAQTLLCRGIPLGQVRIRGGGNARELKHIRRCFPHLPVVYKFLRFWPSQTDWNWLKLTETDWKWLRRTESEVDCKSTRILGVKTIEIAENALQTCRMEGIAKACRP